MYNPNHQREEPPPASAAAYQSAFEELFGPGGQYTARVKSVIVSHPLFQQLLAAHVACLRVATPLEQQHVIDSALANRHHVAAKYLALVNHLQSTSHPCDDQELNHFMIMKESKRGKESVAVGPQLEPGGTTLSLVEYIMLLQSFKEQLQEHLKTQASEAITACQEIERALFNLTGVTYRAGCEESCSSMHAAEEEYFNSGVSHVSGDLEGLGRLGINAFLPQDIQKTLRDHVRRELKHELKKDYACKLKEVRDEILRKRRAGKLPDDTTDVLKDWWLSHSDWPLEMAHLMAGCDQEEVKLRAFPLVLKGEARVWYDALAPSSKATWPTLYGSFLNKYGQGNTPENLWKQLLQHHQGSLGDYNTYESKFTNLWERWSASLQGQGGAPNFLKKDKFVEGMFPTLKEKVEAKFPQTFEEAQEITTVKFKKLLYQEHKSNCVKEREEVNVPQHTNNAQPRVASVSADSHQEDLLHKLTQQLETLTLNLVQAPTRGQQPRDDARPLRRSTQELRCWNCNETGHGMYHCPHPSRISGDMYPP
ncbi:hypothetical protein L7F22_058516 [Adiantum nelumboides]|nr:hypothetical protein [Adiantum nelumboides]